MKIREIIEAAEWIDGSGFSYTTTISNMLVDEPIEYIKENEDWSWYDCDELDEGTDIKLTARYYAEDDEDLENVLFERSVWQSEIE